MGKADTVTLNDGRGAPRRSMRTRGDAYSANCPCRDLLEVVANKWAALAIGALAAEGTLRFGELQRRLEGVSPKVLTATLRRLEDFGLVRREVLPAVPLHVEYSLTEVGSSAVGPVFGMREWAESHYAHALAHAERPADH
ncbi:helix-turn-helix transcriptional regulator [Actinomyces sp. B33]|uniref:winged helix-turn-helix transcriptional regulator n=1 Tax=Actinomyces sp. B33 TaxID=2942131 RepID=UPI00234142ED|nr:helix-turn-helix domain-containing protein [Actinomyces sp. B33]MDC4233742.1 helix-turn-helix transcriptional regulator [Actinomyces sp. B33]